MPLTSMWRAWLAAVVALATMAASARPVHAADEPGVELLEDEPGIRARARLGHGLPRARLELGFGLSSLVDDPGLKQGMGGGFYLGYGMHHRLGVEVSAFFSKNSFQGQLGEVGSILLESFLVGNIGAGPMVQLSPPGSRFVASLETGLGVYVIAPALQDVIWTLGIYGGLTLGWRLTRWFGFGLKLRYHLFNLATLAGPELRDRKALGEVGVVDRLELPGYIAFYF